MVRRVKANLNNVITSKQAGGSAPSSVTIRLKVEKVHPSPTLSTTSSTSRGKGIECQHSVDQQVNEMIQECARNDPHLVCVKLFWCKFCKKYQKRRDHFAKHLKTQHRHELCPHQHGSGSQNLEHELENVESAAESDFTMNEALSSDIENLGVTEKNELETVESAAIGISNLGKRKNPRSVHTKNSKKQKTIIKKQSQIFRLNEHCCFEIFDLLSLKNIGSFAQTCKWSREIVRNYFKLHSSLIKSNRTLSLWGSTMQQYRAIRSIKAPSFKQIYIEHCQLSEVKINFIKKVLKNVEVIKIRKCSIEGGNIHAIFLKYCSNMTSLVLQKNSYEPENGWQCYPMLKHLELDDNRTLEIADLFERNAAVNSFAIDQNLLWQNRGILISGKINLDRLAVKISDHSGIDMQSIIDLIIELHERKFYQRLHVYCSDEHLDQLELLPALEKLCFNNDQNINTMPTLDSVKELTVRFQHESIGSVVKLIVNKLVNLEKIYVSSYLFDPLFPFFQQLPKLRKIRLCGPYPMNSPIYNLRMWNEQRAKLADAIKLTIYVDEEIYIKTKWAMTKMNYSFIELKRESMCEWHNDFGY